MMMNITQSITIKIYDYYDDDDNDTPLLLDWKQKKKHLKARKSHYCIKYQNEQFIPDL